MFQDGVYKEAYYKNSKNIVVIQAEMERRIVHRTQYTILDYLRDMGGLLGALFSLCNIAVLITAYEGYYLTLTSLLFVASP